MSLLQSLLLSLLNIGVRAGTSLEKIYFSNVNETRNDRLEKTLRVALYSANTCKRSIHHYSLLLVDFITSALDYNVQNLILLCRNDPKEMSVKTFLCTENFSPATSDERKKQSNAKKKSEKTEIKEFCFHKSDETYNDEEKKLLIKLQKDRRLLSDFVSANEIPSNIENGHLLYMDFIYDNDDQVKEQSSKEIIAFLENIYLYSKSIPDLSNKNFNIPEQNDFIPSEDTTGKSQKKHRKNALGLCISIEDLEISIKKRINERISFYNKIDYDSQVKSMSNGTKIPSPEKVRIIETFFFTQEKKRTCFTEASTEVNIGKNIKQGFEIPTIIKEVDEDTIAEFSTASYAYKEKEFINNDIVYDKEKDFIFTLAMNISILKPYIQVYSGDFYKEFAKLLIDYNIKHKKYLLSRHQKSESSLNGDEVFNIEKKEKVKCIHIDKTDKTKDESTYDDTTTTGSSSYFVSSSPSSTSPLPLSSLSSLSITSKKKTISSNSAIANSEISRIQPEIKVEQQHDNNNDSEMMDEEAANEKELSCFLELICVHVNRDELQYIIGSILETFNSLIFGDGKEELATYFIPYIIYENTMSFYKEKYYLLARIAFYVNQLTFPKNCDIIHIKNDMKQFINHYREFPHKIVLKIGCFHPPYIAETSHGRNFHSHTIYASKGGEREDLNNQKKDFLYDVPIVSAKSVPLMTSITTILKNSCKCFYEKNKFIIENYKDSINDFSAIAAKLFSSKCFSEDREKITNCIENGILQPYAKSNARNNNKENNDFSNTIKSIIFSAIYY